MAISPKRAVANEQKVSGISQKRDSKETTLGATRLAEFFPGALPMHVPALVERQQRSDSADIQTVIEFGTAREIIFRSEVPLEVGESLRVVSPNCSLDAIAKVVAVQVTNGVYALAVRFTNGAENWIIQE